MIINILGETLLAIAPNYVLPIDTLLILYKPISLSTGDIIDVRWFLYHIIFGMIWLSGTISW